MPNCVRGDRSCIFSLTFIIPPHICRIAFAFSPEHLRPYYYLALVARTRVGSRGYPWVETLLYNRYPDHAAGLRGFGKPTLSFRRYPEAEANLERRFADHEFG